MLLDCEETIENRFKLHAERLLDCKPPMKVKSSAVSFCLFPLQSAVDPVMTSEGFFFNTSFGILCSNFRITCLGIKTWAHVLLLKIPLRPPLMPYQTQILLQSSF
ncbi:hypothetical protein AMECASPLE_005474 [Ameca splendens]|uniref:Uncharacterized protein n=1 Tax=Ameca splendens TaxID=208324 RepID=A0ABV0YYK0_9TELE